LELTEDHDVLLLFSALPATYNPSGPSGDAGGWFSVELRNTDAHEDRWFTLARFHVPNAQLSFVVYSPYSDHEVVHLRAGTWQISGFVTGAPFLLNHVLLSVLAL
jgi:hypothetical protein